MWQKRPTIYASVRMIHTHKHTQDLSLINLALKLLDDVILVAAPRLFVALCGELELIETLRSQCAF